MPIDQATEREWDQARLIPIAGIRGQKEQESRAASALLAVVAAVPDFGHGLLKRMKAPKGKLRTYSEVRLRDRAGDVQTPDGVIVSERGGRRWACLVEFKTGRGQLETPQMKRYLDAARQEGLDGVLTISNQFAPDPEWLPYQVDKRKLRGLAVRHISWWAVLTDAILHHRHRGIDNPDQAYMLGELVRYLTDERSGAAGLEGMGDAWSTVREAARHGTLRANDPNARDVAARWEQFMRYLCLTLSQELGVDVRQQHGRGKDMDARADAGAAHLAMEGALRGSFRVPDAVGPVSVEANLATGQISASVDLDAPKDRKRPLARVNWLLRQLSEAPDDLRIDVRFAQTPAIRSKRLSECRDDPDCLLLPDDRRRDPRSFVLTQSRSMGRRTGRGGSAFVAGTRQLATDFYRDLVQDLRPPPPRPPRLAKEQGPEEPEEPPSTPDAAESDVRREQSGRGDHAEEPGHRPPAAEG